MVLNLHSSLSASKQFTLLYNMLQKRFVLQVCYVNVMNILIIQESCQQCGKVFFSILKFQRHLKTHPGHTCSFCQASFSSPLSLVRHEAKHHKVKVNRKSSSLKVKGHQCGVCWKRFPRARDLEKHSLLHTGTFFVSFLFVLTFFLINESEKLQFLNMFE